MANITINEISQNYTFNTGSANFATVALPITACWGPAFEDPATLGKSVDDVLEETTWQRFPSTQQGFDSFISTFRGPSANYRTAKDYSFHIAQTLLTSGYDVLVCRLCPGTKAETSFSFSGYAGDGTISVKAKYPGTFGNSLRCTLKFVPLKKYASIQVPGTETKVPGGTLGCWNLIIHVIDSSGVKTAVENLTFYLKESTPELAKLHGFPSLYDNMLHISEIESNFVTFEVAGKFNDTEPEDGTFEEDGNTPQESQLTGGTDRQADGKSAKDVEDLVKARYGIESGTCKYLDAVTAACEAEGANLSNLYYKEWLYNNAVNVYDLLKDKLTYSPNRIISPGWDDQDIIELGGEFDGGSKQMDKISPIHLKLMEVAYFSRCGTSLLDVPKSLPRSAIYNEDANTQTAGYAQMLARYIPDNKSFDVNGSLYQTHSALFGPWGQYTYVGTSKQNIAPPSFLALLIQIAMIKNQSVQYEWILPTNRQHKVKIGKMAYTVPKKVLDEWQSLEGVGVNAITTLPDMGTTLWGNSTLYEVPPATYNALANLSTRYLINAVEDIVYRVGISITFQYNNDQAYNKFYAGVTPTLDTMKNVGAITGYKVRMAADIGGLDSVNANTIVGKIYLTVNGVVNDIVVDLIALPPNVDLNQFE